jgi:hypothetical protein
VIVVRDALHERGDSLEPSAGVDRRLGQRNHCAVRLPIELHEHEVPELEEPPRLGAFDEGVERELFAIELGPLTSRAIRETPIPRDVRQVDEDFRARPTRARVRHLPEIVGVAKRVDARVGQPCDLAPKRARFVVSMVDGDAQQRRIDTELFGDELPRKRDRVALEVVAEREVAQHLEERVMPRGVSDLLEIVVLAARAHAFLRRRCAAFSFRRILHPEEDLLELHHTGVREQQRRIVAGNERRARSNDVTVAGEVLEEARSDL